MNAQQKVGAAQLSARLRGVSPPVTADFWYPSAHRWPNSTPCCKSLSFGTVKNGGVKRPFSVIHKPKLWCCGLSTAVSRYPLALIVAPQFLTVPIDRCSGHCIVIHGRQVPDRHLSWEKFFQFGVWSDRFARGIAAVDLLFGANILARCGIHTRSYI